MRRSVSIGRLLGIPIDIEASWPPIFVVVTWLLATRFFPRVVPDLPPASAWGIGFVASSLLFASLLAHEFAHAVVARRRGLVVVRISLFLLGGVAEIDVDRGSAADEFWLSLAGPALSLALGGAAAGVWIGLGGKAPIVGAIAAYLAISNVLLAAFNLLPVFPLDGGRLLHAGLWGATGDWWRATTWASRLGQFGGAIGVVGAGVYAVFAADAMTGVWLAAVGAYLFVAARSAWPVAVPIPLSHRAPDQSTLAS